jgi:Ca-activated chloride channel family protein
MVADLELGNPLALTLLLAVPLLVFVVRRGAGRGQARAVVATMVPLRALQTGWRVRLRTMLPVLRLAAVVLLIVALARPQRAEADATIETEGIDIVIAFDISGSMSEPGLGAPTKMEGAKQALTHFLESRENDRVGLVVFKSETRVMSPLTLDYQAVIQQVAEADTQNRHLRDGTAIGLGIADSVNLLRNSTARTRVIVLATDGENNVHTVSPEQAGVMAQVMRMRIYTIGMPSAGARPELEIDERQMRSIAEATGGNYLRATSTTELEETIESIAALEKSEFRRERLTVYRELAPWLLAPAFGLLALELLLGATLFRRAP